MSDYSCEPNMPNPPEDMGEVSDGYHTFNELYHRCLLFIAWMVSDGCPGNAYWVPEHYPGWDIVVCQIGGRQISYHVPTKFRYLYEKELEELPLEAYKFDGHTSKDVVEIITRWIEL